MRVEWTDLSDSELRMKLVNRGVRLEWALAASRHREHPDWAAAIERVLRP